ncbi:MAG: DUF5926 family protein [Bifidobacteriaceae bacterium]|jgi:hypothetical protein|nr:DUF5926 family protein [Bifidobacteriaceae bacterium]
MADRVEQDTFVARPFEGLAGEADLVAMREILPAAEAWGTLDKAHGGGKVQLVTLLPDLARAWRRADGIPVVALQPGVTTPDVSRDLGNAVEAALAAEPGEVAFPAPLGADGPRLQDILAAGSDLPVTVKESFDYWEDLDPEDEALADAAVRSANEIYPTAAVEGVTSAYWTRMGNREYLRWSLGIEEEALLDGLARLQAKREAGVVDGAKYAGAFRSLGLVIPVWDLPRGTEAADLVEPAAAFLKRLNKALAVKAPLDANERRARAGLVARSLTLR